MKIYAKHPNRSSGDAYAGTIDIIAPGAVLMLIWSLTARGNAPGLIWFRLACAVAATIVLLSRMVLTARIVFSTGSALLALYFPVLIARDLARGIGMLGGIWAFFIRRKAVV